MTTGLPDWTTGVDIIAQTITTLAIDIKAQTLSQLNVNIAASAVTINVSVQGTASISIDAATINIGALRLLDVGTLRRVSGVAANSTVIMYTVPPGKKAYLYAAQMNIERTGTGTILCVLYAYDGATIYPFMSLALPTTVDHANDVLPFTSMVLPADWSIRVVADSKSQARANCVVVEVSA